MAAAEMPMASNDAEPMHRVRVDGFWMDTTTVTNEQFEKFVKATDYVTIAERTPTKEEFPTAPPENLVAGSVVFTPTDQEVPLTDHYQWWSYVKGANWRHPLGPQSDIKGKEKYPVVQIAYPDAEAYAKWAGKRLPTEAEFEFAARGGLAGKTYAWGDEFRPDGKWMANIYAGKISGQRRGRGWLCRNRARRKYFRQTVTAFTTWPETSGNGAAIGIGPIITQSLAESGGVASNPQGPDSPFDPSEPNEKKRVHRGGSFLCNDQYCSRYIVGTRGKGEVNTGTNHLGFRCVQSSQKVAQQTMQNKGLSKRER